MKKKKLFQKILVFLTAMVVSVTSFSVSGITNHIMAATVTTPKSLSWTSSDLDSQNMCSLRQIRWATGRSNSSGIPIHSFKHYAPNERPTRTHTVSVTGVGADTVTGTIPQRSAAIHNYERVMVGPFKTPNNEKIKKIEISYTANSPYPQEGMDWDGFKFINRDLGADEAASGYEICSEIGDINYSGTQTSISRDIVSETSLIWIQLGVFRIRGGKTSRATTTISLDSVKIYYDEVSLTEDPQNASINVNSATVDYGGSVTLTATGTIPNGVRWSNGATTTSITVSNVTSNATYSCTAYGKDGGSDSTKSATITVNNPSFTTNLNTQTSMDPNSSAILSVAAKSYSKVEWQKYNGSSWVKVGDGLSYRVTDSAGNQNGAKYRAIAYGANANATSNTCTVKVNPASITDNNYPLNKTILEDQSVTLECKAKNAKSIQWQRLVNGTWTDLTGKTGAILALDNCKVEDTGNYRAKITGYVNDVIYTRDGATLTVQRRVPQFSITNQAVLEADTAIFTAQADAYSKTFKWYCKKDGESNYTLLTDSTGPVLSDQPYFEGCNTSNLKIRNATLEYNKSTIKCVATNVDVSAEQTATFFVLSKSIDSVHAEYPNEDIAFGDYLDLKDVYVIVRYNNRDASLGKNFEGLTFLDGSTRKRMDTLGPNTFDVKTAFGEQSYQTTLDVLVTDKTAPDITSLSAKWKNRGLTVSANSISKSTEEPVVLTADATDNCQDSESLSYMWTHNAVQIGTGKSIEVSANGIYTVHVSDGINTSEKDIEIKAYDTLVPTIVNVKITPDSAWSKYRIVTVDATDDTLLADLPYSRDGANWQKGNAFYFGENATAKLYVRDCVGNITTQDVEVTHIDNDVPEITKTERTVEYDKVYLQIFATDATSDIVYGYKRNGSVEWNTTGKFEIEEDLQKDEDGRHFYVKDEAENIAYTTLYISSEPFVLNDVKLLLDASIEKNTEDWVNEETGVELTCALSDDDMERYRLYPSYTWSDDSIGEVSEKTVTVHKNGSYSVTMYGKGLNDSKALSKEIISNPITINNIDPTKPSCNSEDDIINNNGVISGIARDKQSGIAKIIVTGGSKAYKDGKVIVDNTEDYLKTQKFDFTVYESGDYLVSIVDRVGNTLEFTYNVEIDTRVPLNIEQVGNCLRMITW